MLVVLRPVEQPAVGEPKAGKGQEERRKSEWSSGESLEGLQGTTHCSLIFTCGPIGRVGRGDHVISTRWILGGFDVYRLMFDVLGVGKSKEIQ
jgi:hypothetical protein